MYKSHILQQDCATSQRCFEHLKQAAFSSYHSTINLNDLLMFWYKCLLLKILVHALDVAMVPHNTFHCVTSVIQLYERILYQRGTYMLNV